MRALKYIGFALLALLVLAAIAAAVAAWRFDPAWAKQKLTQAVYERTQRVLAIEGVPGLSFFPSVGVRLGKASLSEPGSKQQFASVDNARVSVRVMPLLSRQVVVDRIELDGASARIVRDANGKFNFDDLVSPQKEPTAADQGAAQDTPVAFDVGGVAVTRSSILFRDEKAGREFRLSGLSIKTGRLSQSANGPFDVAFVADGAQPKLKLALTAHGKDRYDVARKQFSVEGLDVGVKGDAFGMRQLDGKLQAQEAGVGGAGGSGMQATALVLKAKGQLAQDAFEVQVDVPRLAQTDQRAVGRDATATVRLAGAQRQLDAKVKLAALEGGAERLKIGKLDAQWTLKQGPLAANGAIAGAVDVDLKGQAVLLPKLTGELQVAHPQLPMKQLKLPLDATLRVDWGKSHAAGEWSTRFDESAMKGKFQVTKFTPFAAAVDVAIDRLDVDRYLPQTGAAKSAPEPAKPAPAGKPAPPAAGEPATIDFSFLRDLNLKAAMRVGSLQARNLKFSNVAANLVAANGRLDLNPLTADLYQGRLTGSITAQAEGNRVALKQNLSNVAIGPLMKDYARKDILEGRAHIALDVSAAGQSVAAVRQSLNGSASLNVRDGAIKGINLAKSLREYKSMISGGKQDATVADNKSEKTDFSELAGSFKITNGVARNDDLALKSPFLRATGAGTIDLAREQLDYLAKVSVVATSKGEGGKELAALNGLTIPVHLTGPIDKPNYRLEFGAIAAELAKQQVQKQLGQQVEKAIGKKGLGDALKGLFK